MDYLDAWNGKEMVVSSLEQVCVAIKKFLIATPILSLNMLAQFCSPFFFHYLSAQWSVLEYRKHVAALLLLSTRNMVKLDDFIKKYDAK